VTGRLLAISDLHVGAAENRAHLERLRPASEQDWLLVAGDVGDLAADVEWALRTLRDRFATVIWTPGNHDLWTPPSDPVQLRGDDRYRYLVSVCRGLGVLTPEDPYPVWPGPEGPVVIAPVFVLYDHTFLPPGTDTVEDGIAEAYRTGVVCTDDLLLHPDPYPTRAQWCAARAAATARRLDEIGPDQPTVLLSHWPLVQEPTRRLRYPQFALWCGTTLTASWHRRYRAVAVVFGHLHMPGSSVIDGERFEEVSVGYPQEWQRRSAAPPEPRPVLSEKFSARP